MDVTKFDYSSTRAKKARIGVLLGGPWKTILPLITLALLILGTFLLVIGMPIGWLVASSAVVTYMPWIWYQRELRHLSSDKNIKTVDSIVSSDILGRLPLHPTPRDAANAAGSVMSGLFMGARFGLTPRTIQEMASESTDDMPALWREADAVRQHAGIDHISGSVLAAAILRLFPAADGVMASLKLDDDDLISGVVWQQHLRELIARHTAKRRTGGIARDWTFGYAPLLRRFGQNISEQLSGGGLIHVDIEAHTHAVDQMVQMFGSGGRQNIALVGPDGAGKTTVVHAFADRLLDARSPVPDNLKFRQVVVLDSSALIAAAPGRGELENLVARVLSEAYSAKNIIVCLDNAQLFFEQGIGAVDLSNVLLPILEAGRLRMILTMDEQQFLKIAQRTPSLTNALNRISVGECSQDETMRVMQNQLIMYEFNHKVMYTYQSLKEAYRLSSRYVHDLAMPGKALKLLESAATYAQDGRVTINSVQQAIEKTIDVKVSVASETAERDTLLNLEAHIHERMINQSRAVQVVSDALRRARAGVRNENRPIGTFLFLGPTGVGKTELSKALAGVYFGGEDRMIRLDMNEFVRNEDVARLIADGADDASSLAAQALRQPFSVVLLDEIEKAHPNVLTTLLQLLDEGILRDIKGREVSFRDAIVVATSNAGADRIREYIERGYQLDQFEEQFTNELITSGQFKPEFLNRFDEIVLFRPLNKPELLQVLDLMIQGVNKTLALQKITVEVEQEAKELLVEKGYDPRMGARPMRRVVQRAVENIVAREMLSGNVQPGSAIRITATQVAQMIGSKETADQIISEHSSFGG